MGEDEVRIPIFLDLQDADVKPKLDKLKNAIQEILNTRGTQIKNPFDAWNLGKSVKELEKIRERVREVGEENLSDKEWEKLTYATLKHADTLDRIINKYDYLKQAMLADKGANFLDKTVNAKELSQYIDALNGRIEQTQSLLAKTPSGDNVLDSSKAKIEENIKELQTLIGEIGKYQKQLANAESNARTRTAETSEMKKGGYSEEAIEAQKEIAKAARDSYAEMEKSSAEATASIKQDIRSRISAIQKEEQEIAKQIDLLKHTRGDARYAVTASGAARPGGKWATASSCRNPDGCQGSV